MSKFLPEEILEKIRKASDIVTLISEYVPLKKAGANFSALCPFHPEKTPSFNVSPGRQIFKCFGCGKAGNVFHFLMEMEKIPFPEAVKRLAIKAGIPLDNYIMDNGENAEHERLIQFLEWSASFYEKKLHNEPPALEYLKKRGLNTSTIEQFRLGFAPNSWNDLIAAALKEGFVSDIMEKAGMIVKRKDSADQYFDRFRGRIMFPIWNHENHVIAFGGRVLTAEGQPKYLNSPETPIFSKSRVLYGLNFAKTSIASSKRMMIMEGYVDVLMAHQYGFTEATATLGTSLSEEHAKLIRRFAETIVMIYDGDSAGQKGAERSLVHFLKQSLIVRVVVLPDDLDPCDFLISRKPEEFKNYIEASEDFLDFQIQQIARKYNLADTINRHHALLELSKTLGQIADPIMQRLFVNKLGEVFKIPNDLLIKELKFTIKPKSTENLSNFQVCKHHFQEEDEKFLVWTTLHYPENTEEILKQYGLENFKSQEYAEMAKFVEEFWKDNGTIEISSLLLKLRPELAEKIANLYYTYYGEITEQAIKNRLELIFKGLKREKHIAKLNKFKEILTTSNSDDDAIKTVILKDARSLCQNFLQGKLSQE